MSFDLWFGQTNTKGHMKAGRLLLGLLQKHTEKSTLRKAHVRVHCTGRHLLLLQKGISNFSYFVLFLSLLHLARTLFQYWHEASLRICIQMVYFTKISSSSYVCILWEVSVIVSSGWMPLWAFLWWGLGRGGYIATILLSLSVETICTNDRTNDACSVYNGLDTGVHTGIQSVYKINL